MKNFLILVAMLLSAVAFTVYATPPPGEQSRDIPIVFTPPIPATDQVFDVAIEEASPEIQRHSFALGQELTYQPVVFVLEAPITEPVLDLSRLNLEKAAPETRRHSFVIGERITRKLDDHPENITNKRSTHYRQQPTIVPLS
jgi:hypothetical protein